MLQLALVVAQHRSSNNSLSGVQLSALSVALSKLSHFARSNKGLSTSPVSRAVTVAVITLTWSLINTMAL